MATPPPPTELDEDFEEEIESLRAIYGEDAISVDGPRQITYTFSPNDIKTTVSFHLPDNYPDGVPRLIDIVLGGSPTNRYSELVTELVGLAQDAVGGVYLFELIEAVRDRLLPVMTVASIQPEEHAAFVQVLQANNHHHGSTPVSLEITLPPEILDSIFDQLSKNELRSMARVCRQWRSVAETNRRWQVALDNFLATTIGYASFAPKRFPDFTMTFYNRLKRMAHFDGVDGISPVVQLNYFERSKRGGENNFVKRSRVLKLKTVRQPSREITVCPDGGYGRVISFGPYMAIPTHFIVWTFDLVKLDCLSGTSNDVGDRRFLFGADGAIFHASVDLPLYFSPFNAKYAPTWEEVPTTTKI
eukprot:m.98609 g.98609  ORF g.98609 m.98609 type:complete len:359 (+) comp27083_c1_seq1:528-1604(+)